MRITWILEAMIFPFGVREEIELLITILKIDISLAKHASE